MAGFFRENAPGVSAVFSVVSSFFYVVVAMGFITVRLKLVDGDRASFRALLSNWPVFLKCLGGGIIYVLIVLFGLVLFVVPGIIWSIQFMFWSYHVVDGRMGPVEAFKKSAEDTKGQKVHLFLLALVLFGINVLGLLAIGVGLLVTYPLTKVALAHVYRRLSPRDEAPAPDQLQGQGA